MSWLGKLFGGGSKETTPEFVEYDGYRIFATPANQSGQYRLGARIERDVDGETKVHDLIRADVIRDLEECNEASIRKAKQMIDQVGLRMFDR